MVDKEHGGPGMVSFIVALPTSAVFALSSYWLSGFDGERLFRKISDGFTSTDYFLLIVAILCVLLALYGFILGVRGLRDKERSPLLSALGVSINGCCLAVAILLIGLFSAFALPRIIEWNQENQRMKRPFQSGLSSQPFEITLVRNNLS